MLVLTIQKDLADWAGLNRLLKPTENRAWLTDITHCLNVIELSREEFQDNILLRYGIVPLNLPNDFDGYGKKCLVSHALSCPRGGLILARNNDDSKEWGALLYQYLNPSCISYKPKINSRTVQGDKNGVRAWVATEGQEGEVNEEVEGTTGQTMVPDESR